MWVNQHDRSINPSMRGNGPDMFVLRLWHRLWVEVVVVVVPRRSAIPHTCYTERVAVYLTAAMLYLWQGSISIIDRRQSSKWTKNISDFYFRGTKYHKLFIALIPQLWRAPPYIIWVSGACEVSQCAAAPLYSRLYALLQQQQLLQYGISTSSKSLLQAATTNTVLIVQQ